MRRRNGAFMNFLSDLSFPVRRAVLFGVELMWVVCRNDELNRVLNRIVDVGLRGGWAQLEETPLRIPKVGVVSPPSEEDSSRSDRSSQSPNSA